MGISKVKYGHAVAAAQQEYCGVAFFTPGQIGLPGFEGTILGTMCTVERRNPTKGGLVAR
jgi:hypothetical protein